MNKKFIPLLIVMAAAAAILTCICMTFIQFQVLAKYMRTSQTEDIETLIDSVDYMLTDETNEIFTHMQAQFSREGMQEHESSAIETGDYSDLLERIEAHILEPEESADIVLAYNGSSFWFSSTEDTYRFADSEGKSDLFVYDSSGTCYLAVKFVSDAGISYYILMDIHTYIHNMLPESVTGNNWIVLYNAENHLFIQDLDSQPAYITAGYREALARQDGYSIVAEAEAEDQPLTGTYSYDNAADEQISYKMVAYPSSQLNNQYFSIGIAQNSEGISQHIRTAAYTVHILILIIAICVVIMVHLYITVANRKKEAELARITEAKDRQIQDIETKLAMKKMQPHFLYNALSAIRELVLEDPAQASDLIYDFTVHLRNCIHMMDRNELVPLSEEIKNIEAYSHIEKLRLLHNFELQYDIEDPKFPVAPLSLQPFVENSIRHGIAEKDDDSGLIRVTEHREGDSVRICISDNGTGFDYDLVMAQVRDAGRDSTGLQTSIERIRQTVGGTVNIYSEFEKGTVVEIIIPYQENTEDK